MDLIDEQKHLPVFHYLADHLLDPLLKLAPVLGTGHHAGKVQGHHALFRNGLRYITGSDHLRQTFHHGSLSHTGLADETGIVLGSSAQDLDHTLDLFLPADNRIQFSLSGKSGQIAAVAVQSGGIGLSLRCSGTLQFLPGSCRRILAHGRKQINIKLLDADAQSI